MQHHVTSCCNIVSVLYITEALCQRIPKHQKGLGEKSGLGQLGTMHPAGGWNPWTQLTAPSWPRAGSLWWLTFIPWPKHKKKTATRFTEEPLCLNECEPLHATHSDESGAMFIDFIDCRNATGFPGECKSNVATYCYGLPLSATRVRHCQRPGASNASKPNPTPAMLHIFTRLVS